MSHFHIYKIDPNGKHRVQLTFGNADDYDPVWSNDGRHIMLSRADRRSIGNEKLLEMSANGSHLHRFLGSEAVQRTVEALDNISVISPDGKYKYTVYYSASSDYGAGEIIEAASKRIVGRTAYPYDAVIWLSNSTFGGIRQPDVSSAGSSSGPLFFDICGTDGQKVKSSHLRLESDVPSTGNSPNDFLVDAPITKIEPSNSNEGTYVVWQSWHNSTVGNDYGIFCSTQVRAP